MRLKTWLNKKANEGFLVCDESANGWTDYYPIPGYTLLYRGKRLHDGISISPKQEIVIGDTGQISRAKTAKQLKIV